MNILFLLKSFAVGGVEVVTVIIANKLAEKGHNVSIFAMMPMEKNLSERLSSKVHYYEGMGYNCSKQTVSFLRKIYIEEQIQIVVNQWGLPFLPMKPAYKARHGIDIKFISFFHNDPITNGRIKNVEIALENCGNRVKKILLYVKLILVKKITSMGMKYVYSHSDKFMVLSPSYINHLKKFINVPSEDKQGILTNPVTIDSSGYTYSFENKLKEIIFCGRIDYNQKRVHRLIETWALIEKDFPDWKLTIVGDGVSRMDVEQQTKVLGLRHVCFEGFQQPVEYYKRASILVLTSEYEGFPLVLAECMSFGVVPVVYGSFSAVYDIIIDGVNGIVVPKVDKKFPTEIMAKSLHELMKDECKRNQMALSAIETSKEYSIENIYAKWENVFAEISTKDIKG